MDQGTGAGRAPFEVWCGRCQSFVPVRTTLPGWGLVFRLHTNAAGRVCRGSEEPVPDYRPPEAPGADAAKLYGRPVQIRAAA